VALVDVLLPQWGMGMEEGEVVTWLHEVGDSVQAGEPLVEIEAEKLTNEVLSPVDGVLAEILAHEGDTVVVQGLLARMTTS